MDDYMKLVTTPIIIVLFAFLVLAFAFGVLGGYGKNLPSKTESGYDMASLNSSLSDVQDTANEWQKTFSEDRNIFGTVGLVFSGIYNVGHSMFTFTWAFFDLIFLGSFQVLGVPSVVMGVIIFMLIMAAIFGLWFVLRRVT